jgi:hypothetical protein
MLSLSIKLCSKEHAETQKPTHLPLHVETKASCCFLPLSRIRSSKKEFETNLYKCLLAHLKKNSHEQKHFGSNESRRLHKGKIATKMEMLEFTKLLDRFSSSFCTCEEDRIAGGGGCLPTYPFLRLLSELICGTKPQQTWQMKKSRFLSELIMNRANGFPS